MSDIDTRRRKQLIVGGVSTLLLILVVACVANVIYNSTNDEPQKSNPNLHTSGKSVEMICTSTDYQKTCKDTLSKVVKSDNPDPKEIVHAAVSVILERVGAAFNKTDLIKTSDERVKGAIEDCKELFLNTKDELKSSLEVIVKNGIEHLPNREHDIRTWLSAVISYQQTCVDGFPEGEVKTKLENTMKQAREVTSNALAIVKEANKYISMLDVEGFATKRRLLEDEDEEEEFVGKDDASSWMEEGERRVLREGMAIKLTPNVTVAKDGTGDFRTINAALDAMPKEYTGRYVIYIKPGEYHENVLVTNKMPNVTMYGDSPTSTIITGNKNFIDGTRTFQTATFAAVGEGFVGLRLTFRNTAGAIKHQAVALRVQSDRSIFLACNIEAYQDTLYVQTHRQFYRGCIISGTVDFIFGDAAAVIQNSIIIVRKPLDNQQNIVTAQGRIDRHESTGIVLHKCRILPDESFKQVVSNFSSYLGRPWKEYSKLVIMESDIDGLIQPAGYMPWEGDFGLKTLSFTEYNNKGDGAGVKSRVKWPGVRVLKKEEAKAYTVANFIQGWDWIKKAGVQVPVRMALYDD